MSSIVLKDVYKEYILGKTKVEALRGVSLEVSKSEIMGIIGPSGSGKTTLLNLIGCIDVPTKGEVIIDGENTSTMDDDKLTLIRRHKIGFIFQTFNLIPVLTAYENVEMPLISLGVPKEERHRRVIEMLDKVGLLEFKDHKPDELSGGQRQRVAIARALVINPSIVLADEPTANLDGETGKKIMEIIKTLNQEISTTVIVATHDPRVLQYVERKIYLEDGRIVREE